MNYADVLATVTALHSPAAKAEPMVYQVFEDGEVTLQKGGDLLWQRTLHCVDPGRPDGKGLKPEDMPCQMRSANHGYIFAANEADARTARAAIFRLEQIDGKFLEGLL